MGKKKKKKNCEREREMGIGNPAFVVHSKFMIADMCMRAAIVYSQSVHVLFPLLGISQWFYYQQRKQQKWIREKSGSMWMWRSVLREHTFTWRHYVCACVRMLAFVCVCVNICAPHLILPALTTSQTQNRNCISALHKVAGLKATSSNDWLHRHFCASN